MQRTDRERQSCHLYPGHREMLELPFPVFLKGLEMAPKHLPESSSSLFLGVRRRRRGSVSKKTMALEQMGLRFKSQLPDFLAKSS